LNIYIVVFYILAAFKLSSG